MNKNDINKLFQKLGPKEDKKEELFNKIMDRKDDKMKNNIKEITNKPNKNYKWWRRPMVGGIAMSLLLVVTATAAVFGNFDWFMNKFNPEFKSIVKPVEIYSEDQGIRMEVIGAQKYGNKAIVYLSLQDITGQNRLTEKTGFRDGFSAKMNSKAELSGMSWRQKVIHFNEDTNTIYYEFNITADADSPLADPLELGSFLISFDERKYEYEPINLDLGKIKDIETIPINENNIWGGSNLPDNLNLFKNAMMPGDYATMPHGEKDQWISNIGIIDGKLHVQVGRIFNKEFGSIDAMLSLKDEKGNIIPFDYSLVLLNDEKNRLIDLRKNDYSDAVNKYEEYVFSVDADELSKYTICYTGGVYSGVEGSWKVAAKLSSSNQDIRTWKNDISVEGHLFEYITVSPLGIETIGKYEGDEYTASEMLVEIETEGGMVSLEGGGGSQDIDKHTFSSSWDTTEPLDVTKVTAIVVNGIRIPIK